MGKCDFVVFIDDDDSVNTFHKIVLNLSGICKTAKFFNRPEEALDFFIQLNKNSNSSFPEVIFLDINMPNINGWDFLEKYSKLDIDSNTKIVMLTASIDPEDKERVDKDPMVYTYVSKPLSVIHLKEIVDYETVNKS